MTALWTAFQFFPQEKLRAMAAVELGRRTNRQAEIGPFHLAFGGLIIESLRLSEVPNFRAGIAIEAKGIRLGWDLQSLWEGLNVKNRMITRSRGRFHMDEFHNPHYSAKDFSLTWSLSGIDRTWKHLRGWARLEQGPGLFQNIDRLVATNPSVNLALAPIIVLINMEKDGLINLGLPNLKRWPIDNIRGDYRFNDGYMEVRSFNMASPALRVATEGTVELAGGRLSMDVRLTSPARAVREALDAKVHIYGTVAQPKIDLISLQKTVFKATLSKFLRDRHSGAGINLDDALKKLFR